MTRTAFFLLCTGVFASAVSVASSEVGRGAPAQAQKPRYEQFEKKPPVLDEAEFRRIQKDVLTRCHIETDPGPEQAPWYYYYELGLELGRRGDSPRALDSFVEAAQRRSQPQHFARVYGMWFVDYLPYLHIALAHARLGNRECALDALKVGQRLGETAERTEEYAEIKRLLR